MSLSEAERKALTEVVSAGAALAAAKFGEATKHAWRATEVILSVDEEGPFADVFSSVENDHYGSQFAFPGGVLLFLADGKSGYLIANAFTRQVRDRVEGLNQREAHALGEVSNILLNPLVGHLAKSWGMSLFVSAPQTRIASRRDHLSYALTVSDLGDKLAAAFFIKLAGEAAFGDCEILLFLQRALVDKIAASAKI